MFKRWWGYIVAAGIFIAGMFLYKDEKKWQEKAVSNEEDDLQNDIHQAEVANQQAKVHDDNAHKIKAEAEKESENAKTSTILDRFRRS